MNNKAKGIVLCYTNKCSVKDDFQFLCQIPFWEATGSIEKKKFKVLFQGLGGDKFKK